MTADQFAFTSRRSPVLTTGAMVAASQPLAAQAGLEILRAGGNAADAAVAVAATLNVVEPMSTGVGGDCFALYYDASSRTVTALNGSGRAPAALTLDDLRREGLSRIPEHSPHSVTVPGTVRGWADLLERHGRMTLADVLQSAIRYAERGYPVSPIIAHSWERCTSAFRAEDLPHDFLPEGRAPRPGDVVRLPALARTLRAIAEGGPAAFYEGPIAEAIAARVQAAGGRLAVEDLRAHRSTWETPISTEAFGVRVYECPPNGQGLAALLALNIVRGIDLRGMAPADRLHVLIEAMRLAFADAGHYVADPAFAPAPLDALLSEPYAASRRALINPALAMQPPAFGRPLPGSDTVYLTVVDQQGNACSFINSLYMGFGSGLVVREAGIALQNRGALFSLEPSHPNRLEPGKRPYHTIIPAMATRNGELIASFGVMGGFMQPQGHLQVAVALFVDGLDPQAALDRPRFCILGGEPDGRIAVEEGIPFEVLASLAGRGHQLVPVTGRERGLFGGGQIILRDPASGVLWGGSDPRKDGAAVAF
ncbi:MAG: gamma-glutamyltransferase family protein [Anaerolineae bacterium]|nr:gamma-glutamyltransferase family protein [Anaerolineae bacterium]